MQIILRRNAAQKSMTRRRYSYYCPFVWGESTSDWWIPSHQWLVDSLTPVIGGFPHTSDWWIPSHRARNPERSCLVVISMNKMLNKHSIGRPFGTSWRSCDVIVTSLNSRRLLADLPHHATKQGDLIGHQLGRFAGLHNSSILQDNDSRRKSKKQTTIMWYIVKRKQVLWRSNTRRCNLR